MLAATSSRNVWADAAGAGPNSDAASNAYLVTAEVTAEKRLLTYTPEDLAKAGLLESLAGTHRANDLEPLVVASHLSLKHQATEANVAKATEMARDARQSTEMVDAQLGGSKVRTFFK